MLCISPLNSSMKALGLARTTAEGEAMAAGHASHTSRCFFMFSPLRTPKKKKKKLYPMKTNLCDKTLHSPSWSSKYSILHTRLCASSFVIKCGT